MKQSSIPDFAFSNFLINPISRIAEILTSTNNSNTMWSREISYSRVFIEIGSSIYSSPFVEKFMRRKIRVDSVKVKQCGI